jgi:phosphoesterase RecJ-like protein
MGSPPRDNNPAAIGLPPATPEFDASVQSLLELLEGKQRVVVASHIHPDGDAIGSTLAMLHILERLGKTVLAYNRHPVPYNFQFLPGADRVTDQIPEDFDPELTVLLDCAEAKRIGEDFPEHGWGADVAVVDHHKTWDPDFASVYVRDVGAAATGEVLYRILIAANIPLDLEIARPLYCCLMTDTGSFRYSSTSRATFQIAGELLDVGVDAWDMTSNIYESQPLQRVKLLAEVLATLEVSSCGRLAFIRLELEMFDRLGASTELADGFINFGRSIRGVEVATQMTEIEDGAWKISFRSRGNIDVSLLAERFGGGGHRNAAGCTIQGSPEDVIEQLSTALSELLGD